MLQVIRRLLTRPECFRLEREFAGPGLHREENAPCQGTHNSAAERALRAVALGCKNFLFAGSDSGGERAAAMYTLIGTAKLNGLDPELYLRTVLAQIADHPISQIQDLLPWNLAPSLQNHSSQAP